MNHSNSSTTPRQNTRFVVNKGKPGGEKQEKWRIKKHKKKTEESMREMEPSIFHELLA